LLGQTVQETKVTMSRSLRKHGPRREDAWPCNRAPINRHLEAKDRSTFVPHGGSRASEKSAPR
jgi:hypothetical protein